MPEVTKRSDRTLRPTICLVRLVVVAWECAENLRIQGAISGLSSYLTAARQGALGIRRKSPELDNMACGGDERRSRDHPASCRQVAAVYPGGLPLFSSAASRTACWSNRNAARSSAERRAMKPVR